MNIKAELDNKRLKKLIKEFPEDIDRGVEKSAAELHDSIQNDYLNRRGSGRVYPSGRGRGTHRASAPGQPPAPDTQTYRMSWMWDKISERLYMAYTPDERGPILEYGSSQMQERPHLRPATDAHRKRHKEIMEETFRRILKG